MKNVKLQSTSFQKRLFSHHVSPDKMSVTSTLQKDNPVNQAKGLSKKMTEVGSRDNQHSTNVHTGLTES